MSDTRDWSNNDTRFRDWETLRYQVTYEQGGTCPIVKSIVIDGTKDDMVIKATVRRLSPTSLAPAVH